MRIAISGSSGLVGSRLLPKLKSLGHEVVALVRHPTQSPNEIAPWENESEAQKMSDIDIVVHLAGKPIADARWTDQVKQQIRDSRVEPTRQLCESLTRLSSRPQLLICASATGIYGSRGEEVLDEASDAGDDFLADVAKQWEAACAPATDVGIRVVNTRFGIILDPAGGALKKMLLPAKLLGGSLGSGRQWWSWIALDDVIEAMLHVINQPSVVGPVNFVSPTPIRNREFANELGKALQRPAIFPAPAFALRLALGEMADALLLSSTRVQPKKLIESGYDFRFPDLPAYLRFALS